MEKGKSINLVKKSKKLLMTNRKLKIFIIGVVAYLLSAGISYAGFTLFINLSSGKLTFASPIPSFLTDEKEKIKLDPQELKTEACPLNGQLYTKTEKAIWEARRPLAVMIENHTESRPQSGLSFADIVYEAVAEGGITRFLGVFYCGAAAQSVQLAPVRSARTYFLDWVLEYDALYNHVGGAGLCHDSTVDDRAKALCQIEQYGVKDLDQFGISYPTCFRNPDRTGKTVATEHQMVCLTSKLYEIAAERAWTNVDGQGFAWDEKFRQWKFSTDEETSQGSTIANISFGFWEGYKDFDVRWEYDTATNGYKRFMGYQPHIDFETNSQLIAENIVIQFTKETGPVDEHKHILYETIGKGEALIFQNGTVIRGSWTKAKRTARTLYYNEQGREVKFVPGQIWIEIVPKGNKVTY